MKIDRFRLRMTTRGWGVKRLVNKLIVNAMNMGATDVILELNAGIFVIPPEVLESETLLRLSVSRGRIDGNVRCSRLKSLSLHKVVMKTHMFQDMVSCCGSLIEELSLSYLGGWNLSTWFFSDFASKFTRLKDLSLARCCIQNCPRNRIEFASTSLEKVSFAEVRPRSYELDVPNLVKVSYSGTVIPSLSVKSSRKWESHISIKSSRPRLDFLWYRELQSLYQQLSSSKITLSININNDS